MEAETDSGCEDDVLTHSDGLVNITEEHNGHTDTERSREINLPTTDKGREGCNYSLILFGLVH